MEGNKNTHTHTQHTHTRIHYKRSCGYPISLWNKVRLFLFRRDSFTTLAIQSHVEWTEMITEGKLRCIKGKGRFKTYKTMKSCHDITNKEKVNG